MQIAEYLAQAHSRAVTDAVVDYVAADAERLPELLDVFFTAEIKLVQRAAMALGNLARLKPDWLAPYHTRLIAYADSYPHPSVTRNTMRYFSELPLAKVGAEDQGPLLDLSFRLTADPDMPVGIRVFAMTVVFHFCTPYPELKDELAGVIELTIAEGTTPGFRSRGRKILHAL